MPPYLRRQSLFSMHAVHSSLRLGRSSLCALRILLCERSEYFISSLQTLAGAGKFIMQGFVLLQQPNAYQAAYAAAQVTAVAVQFSG